MHRYRPHTANTTMYKERLTNVFTDDSALVLYINALNICINALKYQGRSDGGGYRDLYPPKISQSKLFMG